MKEIQFRLWDKKSKKLYDSDYVYVGCYGEVIAVNWDNDKRAKVVHKDIQFYTGLKDKNGKEIYEGDILFIPEYCDGDYPTRAHKAEVVFENAEFSLCYGEDGYDNLVQLATTSEVIGNIYENPKLIESCSVEIKIVKKGVEKTMVMHTNLALKDAEKIENFINEKVKK